MNLKRRAQNFGSKFDFVACINPFKVIQSFAYLLEIQLITKEGKCLSWILTHSCHRYIII